MNYYEKRDAKVAIAAELAKRGWTIHGWKEDQSDSMTDYYSPADWQGIASKDGALICVDVNAYTVNTYSGGAKRYGSEPAETCDRCNGTGEEPGALTFTQEKAKGGTVSPIPYFDNGKRKCNGCNGRGRKLRQTTWVEPWPTFQANPARRNWHVEREGKILSSGVGLSACADADSCDKRTVAKGLAAVRALVDKMEAAAFGGSSKPAKRTAEAPQKPADASEATFWTVGVWSWLKFPAKPDEDTLAALHACGWLWSKKREAWYHLEGDAPPALVHYSEKQPA